jgi:hypothetical protein
MDYDDQLKKEKSLYDLLDWENICCADNLYTISQQINSYDSDGSHPGITANQQWVNILIEFINAKN